MLTNSARKQRKYNLVINISVYLHQQFFLGLHSLFLSCKIIKGARDVMFPVTVKAFECGKKCLKISRIKMRGLQRKAQKKLLCPWKSNQASVLYLFSHMIFRICMIFSCKRKHSFYCFLAPICSKRRQIQPLKLFLVIIVFLDTYYVTLIILAINLCHFLLTILTVDNYFNKGHLSGYFFLFLYSI